MRFLPDERLYTRTEECLDFLRGLDPGEPATIGPLRRHHVYWRGMFSRKQAFAVKSFLATQDLGRSELWLWLDGEAGYAGHEGNPVLRPLLPFVRVRRFDPEAEATGTPVAGRPEIYAGLPPVQRSNFVRHVVLYKYGGIYADMDTMFLRDLGALVADKRFGDEFCYRWSSHRPFANSAVLALREGGFTARALLERCATLRTCLPQKVLPFAGDDLDLLVLPCPFFDPLWPHHDRQDTYRGAPFQRFGDFFRPIRFPRRPAVTSYREFFPGAFTYHWHNLWDAAEPRSCYFSRFDREFDEVLCDRLGIDPSRPRA
jgi:Glycosyltransferase sugar-binding region containing DXD motif